ncbi:MAG: DEAD/DEAH box helicase [Planctomycetaceae bacterium]|nr:DEAD/DEAH box helicase [Planctomycetaceae bacterium]
MTQSPLQQILSTFRSVSKSEREKGTYFEELIRTYLRHEPIYADLYSDVWLLSEVPDDVGISKKDTGIDLVAKTRGTGEYHAIQCKFYDAGYHVQKSDIDSFFTASGQKPFKHRLIVVTSDSWSANAEAALFNQQPPVSTIELSDLENSQIDWSKFNPKREPTLKPKYDPRPHQRTAIDKVIAGLKDTDRGKLIMACGTGKTYTSLKIAERIAGKNKRVLFLVPSLALLSQTLTEWTQQSQVPLHSFAVCSDAEVGKKRKKDDDIVQTFVHELRYPATTDAKRLAEEMTKRHDAHHMSVVFSTYHSLEVIHKAQSKFKLEDFDLIICDEAHRTTGATFESEIESTFVRVHDAKFIRASKRLYMTATPRIYADIAKAKAIQENITLCSMDDESVYGHQLHVITFSEAVELGLLTDYKVIVLTIDEDHVSERLQDLLKDDNNQLKVDDAARIIGCWKALSKQGLRGELGNDITPMQRAVAFCQVIEPSTGKAHKVSSKQISEMFQSVIDAYQANTEDNSVTLRCEASHVDGSMNAMEKEAKISWLKETPPENTCRILSNVRCLSEGVDVPALDAVLFLSPRSSQVEVVQSVGRVMRTSKGKKLGYVILPVVIPHGMQAHEALNDNKVYKVVWEVLQALRSHDDRFDAFINKVDLMQSTAGRMEVIAITDKLSPKSKSKADKKGKGEFDLANKSSEPQAKQLRMHFEVGELEKALYARLVQKCGNRLYWEEWAGDIAKIAQTHIGRIKAILKNPKNTKEIEAFSRFANELRDDLNDSITDEEVIEMLAQHLITKPVFDALFAGYSFASNNPVSKGMQNILDLLNEHRLDKEADTLEKFYDSVRRRAAGIDKAEGKQKIVVELYDKFFRNAFPRMTERLGIVYTPVEVVDFILHSVNDILQEEFGVTLGTKGVHILDPFVGTGTFITRLLQSGLITPEQMPHKYKHEIHCNEIVLLAYYIAAINIEAVYHSIVGGKYQPFEGILLTDTFQMYESSDTLDAFFPDNSERRKRQKKLDIRVIVGNPPYSSADKDDTNVKNTSYALLDNRIATTYVESSSRQMGKSKIYDSYIRAIRWASDRIGKSGVVGFVTNASYLDANSSDGIRKCLAEEFDKIYVFHLRGNQRTSGERSRQEGGKIFGSGSRAPIAITFLVKNGTASNSAAHCNADIKWHDIGDYLTQEQKLSTIAAFRSVIGIREAGLWSAVSPNIHHDWFSQRDDSFSEFMKLGDKQSATEPTMFATYSMGVKSNRDDWVYNFSSEELQKTLKRAIKFYNAESKRIRENELSEVDLDRDKQKIKWTSDLTNQALMGIVHSFDPNAVRKSLYRPFTNQWSYFDPSWNWTRHLTFKFFPEPTTKNLVIIVPGTGSTKEFCVLITDGLFDLEVISKGQGFPLFLYEPDIKSTNGTLKFGDVVNDGQTDGLLDQGLVHFQKHYDRKMSKEDLFYYVYGLLHSEDYRNRYADNLSKELPRIPAVKKFEDFQKFAQAGRDLAHWHLNYETVECYPVKFELTGSVGKLSALKPEQFRVVKMKHPKRRDPETGKSVNDKSTVIYNEYITVTGIPLEAYDYVVNGKSAIEWVMERQAVTTDKDSGIVNDANLWATETMNNAAYPLELLLRVITVSLETNRIVKSLPRLELETRSTQQEDPNLQFLIRQVGDSPKHRQIYRSIRETVSNSSDARLKFSQVKDVARMANVSNQDVLGVLSLLSANSDSSSIRLEFRRITEDRFEPVSDIQVNEMLSLWASEEKAVQSDWTKFARDIEVSWKIKSDDNLGAIE